MCITAQCRVDLILNGHLPIDLARWALGIDATYKDLLAFSPTIEDLCTYLSIRLGLTTKLYILYITRVLQVIMPL